MRVIMQHNARHCITNVDPNDFAALRKAARRASAGGSRKKHSTKKSAGKKPTRKSGSTRKSGGKRATSPARERGTTPQRLSKIKGKGKGKAKASVSATMAKSVAAESEDLEEGQEGYEPGVNLDEYEDDGWLVDDEEDEGLKAAMAQSSTAERQRSGFDIDRYRKVGPDGKKGKVDFEVAEEAWKRRRASDDAAATPPALLSYLLNKAESESPPELPESAFRKR